MKKGSGVTGPSGENIGKQGSSGQLNVSPSPRKEGEKENASGEEKRSRSSSAADAKATKPAEPAQKTEKPKRPPLNVEEFWKHEQALGIHQRRARYNCDYFFRLEDVPTWASDSAVLDLPDREQSISKLKKSFEEYDATIAKSAQRAEDRAVLLAKLHSKREARELKKKEKRAEMRRQRELERGNAAADDEEESEEESDEESSSDTESEDSNDSEAELSEEMKKKRRRARMLLMQEPDPDPADLVPYSDQEKFSYEPNEDINQKVSLWQGDITTLEIDAIVNAANETLRGGGGIDGAIHSAAGPTLLDECIPLNGCPTGQTKITRGHRLPSQYILHTVGPQVGGTSRHLPRAKLEGCYSSCLHLAEKHGIRSMAFCSISTGIFSYPIDMASHTALRTVRLWLESAENRAKVDRIIFCVFSDQDREVYERMMPIYFPPAVHPEIATLPCSDAENWSRIVEALRQPIGKVEQLAEYLHNVSPHNSDVGSLTAYLLEIMPRKDSSTFLKKEFSKMAELALRLPHLFKAESDGEASESGAVTLDLSNLRLLIQGMPQQVKLSQEQVACLLACSFFGLLPRQSFHGQKFAEPNLSALFRSHPQPASPNEELLFERAKKNQFAKIHCILHYFRRVLAALPNEHELIFRRKVFEDSVPDWRKGGEERIVDAHDFQTSLAQSSQGGEYQLLASSRLPSEGVLNTAPVVSRSDLRWFMNPELFVVSFLASDLLPNESIEVRGVETFCDCQVDSDGVMYFKENHTDTTETDEGVRRNRILLVDPVVEKDLQLMWRPYNIFKDLAKLYAALYEEPPKPKLVATPSSDDVKKKVEKEKEKDKEKEFEISGKPPAFHVATDDWGCDARFGGEPYLRAVQVLLASSAFNSVAAGAPDKFLAKHAAEKRPEVYFHQSRAGADLHKLVQILHHEQVPIKYVTRMLLGKVSRDPKAGVEFLPADPKSGQQPVESDANVCARLTVLFRNWKKELKRMKEEQERKRREEEKRKQKEWEETRKRQKAALKEYEKNKKQKEKEKEAAEKDSAKEKEKEQVVVHEEKKTKDEAPPSSPTKAKKFPKAETDTEVLQEEPKKKGKKSGAQSDVEGLTPHDDDEKKKKKAKS